MEENAENQIKNTNKKKDYVILKFCVITDLEGGITAGKSQVAIG